MIEAGFHRRVDQLRIRWIDSGSGSERFAISNDVTGAVFRCDRRIVTFLGHLDGRTHPKQAASAAGIEPADLEQAMAQLARNGLIYRPGETLAQPAKRPPLESRMIFFRIGLGDVARLIEAILPLARFPFTPIGVAIWALLVASAAYALLGSWDAFQQAAGALSELTWRGAATLAVIFIVLKILHEIGHATALRHFSEVEGMSTGPIQVGIAFFALMPIPFTDATEAWLLRNRFRRAAIGLAGIYFESWIAALAALAWATIRPGEIQTILFQVLIIAGVSTLLFNLNPLVRLDGYFVLTDLIGKPNLASRAAIAARNAMLRVIGASAGPSGAGYLAYWLACSLYRWVIFAGIFWIAYAIDPRLAWAVIPLALMILIIRPVMNLVTAARVHSGSPVRLAGVLVVGSLLMAGMVVPAPDNLYIDGRLVLSRSEALRLNEDARIQHAAPMGWVAPSEVIVTAESPELALSIAHLRLDASRIEGALRSDGLNDAAAQQVLRASLDQVMTQMAGWVARLQALEATKPVRVFWQPEAARDFQSAWVAAYDNRVLGTIAQPGPARVEAFLAQREFDDTTRFATGAVVQMKARQRPACTTEGQVIDQVVTMLGEEEFFRLQVAVDQMEQCFEGLPDGSGAVLRLARERKALVWQAFRYFERLAQSRIPLPASR